MFKANYYINDDEVNPVNQQESTIELNVDHDEGSPTPSVATNKWTFENEDAKKITDHIDTGLNGGAGIHQGLPFKIVLNDGSVSKTFKKYLDCGGETAIISCDECEIESFDIASIDWINKKADSISIKFIQETTNLLPRSKAVAIPYVLNSIPNYRDAIICSVSIFVMEQSLRKAASDIAATIAATAGVFNSAGEVIRFIAQIIYIIILIAAIVSLIKRLLNLIIQPVKYHAAMYVLDQVRACCTYLGLTFASTILESEPYNRTVILPEKFQNPTMAGNADLLGFDAFDYVTQTGYYNGTFGQLLRALKQIFKAKIIFDGNIMRFEKRDYKVANTASYIIPDILQLKYTTNASKLISTYYIKFSTDLDDKNTIQQYNGTVLEATTSPIVIPDRLLNLLRTEETVEIPFSLAKTKRELSAPEQIVSDFLTVISELMQFLADVTVNPFIAIARGIVDIINDIIDAINVFLPSDDEMDEVPMDNLQYVVIPDFGNIINDRIGMLLLETDCVIVPKIFILKEGANTRQNHIDPGNDTFFSARYLWDNFHYVISHVPTIDRPNADQWRRKKLTDVPFTFDDFQKVVNSAPVFDVEGNVARIVSLKWNYWTLLADIDYEINKVYDKNLTLSLSNGNGF